MVVRSLWFDGGLWRFSFVVVRVLGLRSCVRAVWLVSLLFLSSFVVVVFFSVSC
jgi:hypothetical protein